MPYVRAWADNFASVAAAPHHLRGNAKLTIFRQRKGRRRPKIIQPALALANFGAQPGFVVINAFLRTKALERSPMPHQAELAMAVSAGSGFNLLRTLLKTGTICGATRSEVRKTTRARRSYFRDVATGAFIFR
jgi:hypothetical protein